MRTAAASGSCSASETRSAATCDRVGGVVGQDRDLGRAGLGVDPDQALEQPLGRHDVDVARAGDQVDARARAGAVGEHGDRLGAADGVHLVDAEQRAGGQDRRVRQPAVLLLRRAGQRDRLDARDLGGHDVHQHGRDQRREAAGDVEADPADRDLAVGDPGAGAEVGDHVVLELALAGRAQAADRLLQARADVGVEPVQRLGHGLDGHPDVLLRDVVEALGELADRVQPAGAHGLADGGDRRDRRLDVEVGARDAPRGSRRARRCRRRRHGGRCDGSWPDSTRTSAGPTNSRPDAGTGPTRGRRGRGVPATD